VRLVYVAVTRATHEVMLTYSQESAVVARLAV
jgi:ATP-dependent exoDNAse (exonuclease V) beta subunit